MTPPRVTWLGHGSVLIELEGVRLVTDPLLRRRVFHLRRQVPVLDTPPDVDAVLISHVHWDHLDLPSVARFGKQTQLVVPRGAGKLVRRAGFKQVEELEPGESVRIESVDVRATHAEHDVGGLLRRAKAPALGFVISGGSRVVYFAGDTDIFAGMSTLADDLDVALLPIAGWGPTLPPGHMDARGAATALGLLRPRIAVPIHWGTYAAPRFRSTPRTSPAEDFRTLASELAPTVEVDVLAVGESLTF